MRLIDEEALIEEAQTGGWDINIKELKMALEYVPTIDARQLALKTKVCQMCEDCPDGCPVETPKAGIVTNANHIRNMSDEELAEYIFDLGNGSEYCYGHCAYQDDCDTNIGLDHDTCIKGVIEWLKQPAKEV